ncbi:unnamed protein product [Cylicocyclus nassatus]|uniref:Uncharacterized protein n=1 Tax=Cylicocyclus nassatus TaxID=53992 RepID=A0AA36HBH2_CYLNA|nr:unnamed protein product [Cylicocyclus nassatus]
MLFVVSLTISAIVCAQAQSQPTPQNGLRCGFSCTRTANFTGSIDGVMTTATCTVDGMNPRDRCEGCCQARALAAGLTAFDGAGFPSNNGHDCVCCIYNACK